MGYRDPPLPPNRFRAPPPGLFGDIHERNVGARRVPGRVFRDGELVCVPHGATFPDRCVLCNEPANGQRARVTKRWTGEGEGEIAFSVGVCEIHRERHRIGRVLIWAGPFLALVFMMVGFRIVAESQMGIVSSLTLVMFFGTIFVASRWRTLATFQRIGEDASWLTCNAEFRDSLPRTRG
jgi:hypothetical protein